MLGAAEKLPVNNDSVDLVNASLAAHWFNVDKFTKEAARVLNTNGCLAVHAFYPGLEVEYKDLSHDLNKVISEIWNTLNPYTDPIGINLMRSQYHDIYESIPLKDKTWITDIPVQFQMSISEILGFFRTVYMFQIFLEKDEKRAEEFLMQTKRRMQDILGEEADSVLLNVHMKNYCVLACKH
ncbi:hypothetical protein GDO81_017258 [Engystomops pustulosus]|uniref:Methyltransferase type 11 domain-containing protein n=2 Tax=Engystomops pustulosus TaxID=76066 RepID=A0AAV7AD83_ENGPU|nr:hypothetical protein GDO81_017258 [Engystomops pustulosus]